MVERKFQISRTFAAANDRERWFVKGEFVDIWQQQRYNLKYHSSLAVNFRVAPYMIRSQRTLLMPVRAPLV